VFQALDVIFTNAQVFQALDVIRLPYIALTAGYADKFFLF
jgi:hypothetical protein